MNVRKALPILLTLLVVALAAPVLRANSVIDATLVQSIFSAAPGSTVTFQFSLISNPSTTDTIFLNSASGVTPTTSLITIDATPFFNNTPLSLAPLGSAPGAPLELFTAMLDLSIAPGDYLGTFSIFGGLDGNSNSDLVDIPFEIDVAPTTNVPEPGTLPMLILGAALASALSLLKLRSA